MVNDLRTGVKISNVANILDGMLDAFILAYLREEESTRAWAE